MAARGSHRMCIGALPARSLRPAAPRYAAGQEMSRGCRCEASAGSHKGVDGRAQGHAHPAQKSYCLTSPAMADRTRIRRALLSVSDKTGLVGLAEALAQHGVELISTGRTRTALLN